MIQIYTKMFRLNLLPFTRYPYPLPLPLPFTLYRNPPFRNADQLIVLNIIQI